MAVAAVALAALAVVLTRGGDDDDVVVSSSSTTVEDGEGGDAATTTTAPEPTTTETTVATTTTAAPGLTSRALTQSCTRDDVGYAIRYPEGWFAELSFPAWACALFDEDEFAVDPDTEVPRVDVIVSNPPFPFDESVAQYTDPAYASVLSARELTVVEQRAVVVEIEQVEEIVLPAGTRRYAVLVDWFGSTVIVEADSASADDYDAVKKIVLAMAMSLRPLGG